MPPPPHHTHTPSLTFTSRAQPPSLSRLQPAPDGQYTETVDLYSAGVMLLELVAKFYVGLPGLFSLAGAGTQSWVLNAGMGVLRGSTDPDVQSFLGIVAALVEQAPGARSSAGASVGLLKALRGEIKVGGGVVCALELELGQG